jgi:hypothetical protein
MTDSDNRGSSIVRRWQLAAALKGFREEAGLTQGQAVAALQRAGGRWSESKLSRIENHESGVRPREVEQLLDAYEVTDPAVREPLLSLAEAARERDWRTNYGPDLPESLRPLVSIENAVTAIRQFETMVVPGLLQTADYTRAVIETVDPAATTAIEVERRVARRITRQHILRRPQPPTFHLILDEGVLRRTVGTRSVMRDQLRKLVDLAEAPHMTVQVLPFEAGGGALRGPFTLLSLPDPASDIVYGEGIVTGTVFVEDRETVRTCTLRFGMLTHLALPRAESLDALREAASSFE